MSSANVSERSSTVVNARTLNGDDFLAQLLDEQQSLTAVELFSQQQSCSTSPTQEKYYSKLIPLSIPQLGQQYAFEVNLDNCSGCKACVTACHSLNGLDEEETWRDVGLLIGGTTSFPVMQHVTTACHHCIEPGCMAACPVDAYEKDPLTGIVRHLDDQCFGCQYCTLACPYDVPKYHSKKGIVRKCDMCSDRLGVGEAPACVQACPHEAIAIRIVDIATVRENAEADYFLPGAPDPQITLPTTHYKTNRVFPRNTLPADYYSVSPQHPHWPLIIMLVLTQLSVGAFAVGMVLESLIDATLMSQYRPIHATMSLVFGLIALNASTLHLGRPQYAFRGIIGLRHSWLSREILAFGVFAGAAAVYAGLSWFPVVDQSLIVAAGWNAVAIGYVGVFCSVMIYVFTKREFWTFSKTGIKFGLTSILMGLSATFTALSGMAYFAGSQIALTICTEIREPVLYSLMLVIAIKLFYELSLVFHLKSGRNTPMKQSARLTFGVLSKQTAVRVLSGILGGLLLPMAILSQPGSDFSLSTTTIFLSGLSFVAVLIGELMERYQFFAAVATRRMPGGPRR